MRKIFLVSMLLAFSLSLSGCLGIVAGAGGTALWQGGKVVSEENFPMKKVVAAAKSAFSAEKITLLDEVDRDEVVQLRGEDPGKKKVAVDVFKTGEKSSRIEIRFGLGEETPGRELLLKIKKRI